MIPMSAFHGGDWMPRPVTDALGFLESEARIAERLKYLASAYGKVVSVTPIPRSTEEERKVSVFLVDFEDTRGAMAASHGLKCYLIGFSTLVVPVPRHTDPPIPVSRSDRNSQEGAGAPGGWASVVAAQDR